MVKLILCTATSVVGGKLSLGKVTVKFSDVPETLGSTTAPAKPEGLVSVRYFGAVKFRFCILSQNVGFQQFIVLLLRQLFLL